MPTILHLTDIHFGREEDNSTEQTERKICLDSLLSELNKLEASWKPSIICITGDIGWRGCATDYSAARKWLDKLLRICGLTYNELIVCPGNHDVSRVNAITIPRSESAEDTDKSFVVPIAEHFEKPFMDFATFCREAGIPACQFGKYQSHLVGLRQLNDLRFIVLNSCWFSKDDKDEGKLWIGQPFLKYLDAEDQLPLIESHQSVPVTVALVHHPPNWYHQDERRVSGSRPNTCDYLATRCHVLLTGHTHGEVRKADTMAECAIHFTGGAIYAGTSYSNSFRLVQIQAEHLDYRSFEYDSRTPENRWRHHTASSVPLPYLKQKPIILDGIASEFKIDEFRVSFREDAARQLERKSRLLRQSGILPATVQRPVSIRVSAQRDKYDASGRFIRAKDAEQQMLFYDAVRVARRTLLLGDLGTGKSTLAAQLVMETIDQSKSAVAVFIPAKALHLSGQFTQRELLNAIDNYIADEIWLKTPRFNLVSILEQRVEVLLVFDGLDELAREVAVRLIRQAATLVENWPTIQIVSTARPVELVGVSYADWRIVHTVALDDLAKADFIRQELIADGTSPELLHKKTAVLLQSLQEMIALDSIANSPLAIRLIYPRLSSVSSDTSLTLGDLLYDLLLERLGGWQQRDDKPSSFAQLDQALPTPEAKAEFLAVLAEKAVKGKQVGLDEAKALLQDTAANFAVSNRYQIAAEALSCFEWLGLITKAQTIEFPLQPLAEMCAAVGIFAHWCSESDRGEQLEKAQWRVVSFAATIARRRGTLEKLREPLSAFLDLLLKERSYIPAACYIVVEATDAILAGHTVRLIDNLGYRPLTFFQDEFRISARNIAKTLVLAGDSGFDWFYKDYLDPRFPIPNAGCAIVREVFAEWAALVRQTLTVPQKEKLAMLVMPYQATCEGHFFGAQTILSILIPDAFSPEDRFWYQSLALDDRLFAGWAKQQLIIFMKRGELVGDLNDLLLHRSGESLQAARLWLEFNPNAEVPFGVVRRGIRAAAKSESGTEEAEFVNQCRQRLGEERWFRCAKWALVAEEAEVAAGAAKIMYDAGERRLSILGDVAMRAMHDGGYVAQAEKILTALVQQSGHAGVYWLANRMAHSEEWGGAHSGWWRVLLGSIDGFEDGPARIAACAHTLGPFTLPRHPEVREGFARLLNGPRGMSFRAALRSQLRNLDPEIRRGAAMILISSDPQGEADALFVAVRSRANRRSSDWHEWEDFCLTLDFGPGILVALKNRLGLIDAESKALALVLLERGGIELEPSYRQELMTTLSSLGNWHLRHGQAGQTVMSTQESFAMLMGYLEKPGSELAQSAAERLLEYHRARLNPAEEALCIALRHGTSSWNWGLADIMKRVSHERDLALRLIEASKEICKKGGRESLIGLVAKAITNKDGWKDVVWALLCDDTRFGGSSESEAGGMALLEFGLEAKEYRSSLGKAAKECLVDPRLQQNRWHDAYHWLALIADEFDGLDTDTIQRTILHGMPILYSATTALIARLGKVPDGFSCRRGEYRRRPTTFAESVPKAKDLSSAIRQLKDYARDSEELHPAVIGTLQECLFLPSLDESTLSSISAVGRPGILISTTLRFIYGLEPKLAETIPMLDLGAKIWSAERRDRQSEKLIQIWRMIRGRANDDVALKTNYLVALDKALLESSLWKLAIAWEILEIRGGLTEEQIPIVFADYAAYPTFLHEVLFARFCAWLSGDVKEATQNAASLAAGTAIVTLNEAAWAPDPSAHPNPLADLLFPVIAWAFCSKSSDESEAVFLRGIRSIFDCLPSSRDVPRTDVTKLLARLDPLLAKVPREILGRVVRRGAESLEPSVSAFCRLIESFGAHLGSD